MTTAQMRDLAAKGHATAGARAIVRQQLKNGHITVAEILHEKPASVADVLLIDVLRWQRWMGDTRLRALNREAIALHLNLCVPVRCAGVEHAAFIDEWMRKRLGQRARDERARVAA